MIILLAALGQHIAIVYVGSCRAGVFIKDDEVVLSVAMGMVKIMMVLRYGRDLRLR